MRNLDTATVKTIVVRLVSLYEGNGVAAVDIELRVFIQQVQALFSDDLERLDLRLSKTANRLFKGFGLDDYMRENLNFRFLQTVSSFTTAREKCRAFHFAVLEALSVLEKRKQVGPQLALANAVKSHVKAISIEEFAVLSVEYLAEHFGVSRSHLSRAFMTAFGRTLQDFLTSERMNRAYQLLQNKEPQFSVENVARKIGFCDKAHFRSLFKKWFGKSPGRVRMALGDSDAHE